MKNNRYEDSNFFAGLAINLIATVIFISTFYNDAMPKYINIAGYLVFFIVVIILDLIFVYGIEYLRNNMKDEFPDQAHLPDDFKPVYRNRPYGDMDVDIHSGEIVKRQFKMYPGRTLDESHEIELESGEFLGQFGAVVAEPYDPERLGIEVWMFDMFSSRNIAKIMLTDYALHNQSLYNKAVNDVNDPETDIYPFDIGSVYIKSEKLVVKFEFFNVKYEAFGKYDKAFIRSFDCIATAYLNTDLQNA